MRVSLEEFDREFLDLSWTWLNDPEVRFLTNSVEITREQQNEWFNTLPGRKDYLIWGVRAGSVAVGVCGLKNITSADCEYWGYIGEKAYWGKGLGTQIMDLLEEKARVSGKTSIWLKVIRENQRAIALYSKRNYSIESESELFLLMRKKL